MRIREYLLPGDRKRWLPALIIALMAFSILAYVSSVPRPREQFLQLYVLGPDKEAGGYYPNNSTYIPPSVPISWYLGVENSMNSVQMVTLMVKLGNQTSSAPNVDLLAPSDLPVVAEFQQVLPRNQTWELPFAWSIAQRRWMGNTEFLTLNIDGRGSVPIDTIGAIDGKNFRIIVEVWTYDIESDQLTFGWKSNGVRRAAWLQLWFDANNVS